MRSLCIHRKGTKICTYSSFYILAVLSNPYLVTFINSSHIFIVGCDWRWTRNCNHRPISLLPTYKFSGIWLCWQNRHLPLILPDCSHQIATLTEWTLPPLHSKPLELIREATPILPYCATRIQPPAMQFKKQVWRGEKVTKNVEVLPTEGFWQLEYNPLPKPISVVTPSDGFPTYTSTSRKKPLQLSAITHTLNPLFTGFLGRYCFMDERPAEGRGFISLISCCM